jgi:hypothetical protein
MVIECAKVAIGRVSELHRGFFAAVLPAYGSAALLAVPPGYPAPSRAFVMLHATGGMNSPMVLNRGRSALHFVTR